MGGSNPEVLAGRHKGQQPVGMDLVRGEKNPQKFHIRLIEPDEGSIDPFKAIDETGTALQLNQRERLLAYAVWGAPAPDNLTRGLGTSRRIAKRAVEKKNREPVRAKSAEALDTLVRDN